MSDRCYGCCQENCDSRPNCGCWCHRHGRDEIPTGQSTRQIIDMPKACSVCGLFGAHYCPGRRDLPEIAELGKAFELAKALGKPVACKTHHRYQGLRRPRTLCEDCWRHWIALNPR